MKQFRMSLADFHASGLAIRNQSDNWTEDDLKGRSLRPTARTVADSAVKDGGAGRVEKKAVEPRRGRMNKTEALYASQVLAVQLHIGEINWYGFEPFRLRLADGAWYCPDFAVLNKHGMLEFIEIKGFWRESARLRIKVAADIYPFKFTAVRRIKGQWKAEVIK